MLDDRAAATNAAESGIVHLYRTVKARTKSLAGRFHGDLQPVGYAILRMVLDDEPLRASDVAAALGMDKSAVSRQIGMLRELGLLDTHVDPADGRATLLSATAQARALQASLRSESAGELTEVFAGWPTDDVAEFARLLGKFNAATH